MDNNAAPRKKRLHPEVAGILGILGILILIAFVMCAVNGRFEQWFGWTVFTGPKAYDSVVFAEIDGDSENLVVLNINKGTKETILTGAHISGIAVSRSGGKIAYVSPVDDIDQIFTIGPTGKKNKALTVGGNSKSKPGFSPDGAYVTYISKGKLYKTDLSGGTTRDIVPTRQQLQQFVSERGETLVCKDYTWAKNGDGMLAVVSRGEHLDRFVLVMNGNDAHEIMVNEQLLMDIDSVSASADGSFYIATGKLFERNDPDKPVYTVFGIQVPENHSHAEGSEDELNFAPIYQTNAEISNGAISLNGQSVMVGINGKDEMNGVFLVDFNEQKVTGLLPDYYEIIDTPLFANGLFCQNGNILDYYDFETEVKTDISGDCKCFALSPVSESKEKIHGGPQIEGEHDHDH